MRTEHEPGEDLVEGLLLVYGLLLLHLLLLKPTVAHSQDHNDDPQTLPVGDGPRPGRKAIVELLLKLRKVGFSLKLGQYSLALAT